MSEVLTLNSLDEGLKLIKAELSWVPSKYLAEYENYPHPASELVHSAKLKVKAASVK